MKFPKKLRHKGRGKVLARIYKSKNTGKYVVYWRADIDGKRKQLLKEFRLYTEAAKFGREKVTELATKKLSATLTPKQVAEALAAFARLHAFKVATGKELSLPEAVSEYCDSAQKLRGHTMHHAIDTFLTTAATLQRKDLKQAVLDFVALDEPKTKAKPGERAQMGKGYLSQKKWHLTKLANLFQNLAVSDLTKDHIDRFFKELPNLPQRMTNAAKPNSPKARNHYRGSLRQFFAWGVRNDLLPGNHRLNEAESMKPEPTNGGGETLTYTPAEFRRLLEGPDELDERKLPAGEREHARKRHAVLMNRHAMLLPVLAINGQAGCRVAELMRMDFQGDVFKIPGHIEVSKQKSKTRSRRLVEMCPALAEWLNPYRQKTGKLWPLDESKFQDYFLELCQELKIDRRHNALRHSYCSALFAVTGDENRVAQMSGNSPNVIHRHYASLMTRAEGEAWFAVRPAAKDNVVPMMKEQA